MSHFMSIETGIWPKDIRGSHVIDRGFTTEIRKPTALHSTYSIFRTTERSMYFLTILGLCTLVAALPRVKRQVKSLMNKYTLTFFYIFGFFFLFWPFFLIVWSCISSSWYICLISHNVESWHQRLLYKYFLIIRWLKILRYQFHLIAWPRVALHALL